MSREIKFRVWDKTLQKFISPSSLFLDANGKISDLDGEYIIQQFTGKTDINNIEIYEGDLVNAYIKDIGERAYRVKFINQSFVLVEIMTELEVNEFFVEMNVPEKLLVIGHILKSNEQDTSYL